MKPFPISHDVPTFVHYPASGGKKDGLSSAAAQALAEQIRSVWAAQGYEVNAWVEAAQHRAPTHGRTEPIYVVRTDMVNGMPRRRAS